VGVVGRHTAGSARARGRGAFVRNRGARVGDGVLGALRVARRKAAALVAQTAIEGKPAIQEASHCCAVPWELMLRRTIASWRDFPVNFLVRVRIV
jgi:hypothetical protein